MEPQKVGETKKSSNKLMKIFVGMFMVLLAIVLVTAGVGAFWWRNDQANKQKAKDAETISQLQKDLSEAKKQISEQVLKNSDTETINITPAPTLSSKQPSASTLENIKASFVSKNTAALEGYMAAKVNVVYAASEFAGEKTPAQAVAAMDYVNSGAVAPWNFNLDAATLANYATGDYSQYFKPTTYVGRSGNGYVVAVNFDSTGKINGLFVSASDSLL